MAYQIYISRKQNKVSYSLTDGNKLIEYVSVGNAADCINGTVINGCIQEQASSLEACFVNIGPYRQAFLPLDGKDQATFKTGLSLPVQIKKGPSEEKGAKVSEKIEFTGNYWVLIGNDNRYGVSGKISKGKERERLLSLAKNLSENNSYCFLARTKSEGVEDSILLKEAESLINQYREILKKSKLLPVGTVLSKAQTPCDLWLGRYEINRIVLDSLQDKLDFEQTHPELKEKLYLYQDDRFSLEDVYKISSQLTKASQRTMFLEGTGSVIFDETPACTVIDVNSGKGDDKQKEKQVLDTNLKAAKLVLEQLRLRNIGGAILIDFINMKEKDSQDQLLQFINQKSQEDSSAIKIYGFTHLGLLELSREQKGIRLKDSLA